MMAPGDTELAATAPVTCLLVDDLPENLLALEALLRTDGLRILQAGSGAEALELLLQHDVALALLDVQMPEMDGFELAELMRGAERTRRVPIIFLTAGGHEQHRVFRGYDSGAVDFLHKPVEPRVLKNKAAVFFELYRQRQQMASELRQKSEALALSEMMMAVLGHDLRGPLSAMLMSAMVLEKRVENDKLRAAATRIIGSGKRMGRMIEDLLDLARTRAGGSGIGIHPVRIDLAGPVARIVDEQRDASPDRRIEWQQVGDCSGSWDADRIAQVVSNLVGNALRHGDPAEPVAVHIDGSEPGRVELSVANAGGIPAEVLPHIFDPFRSGRPRGSGDGLGIGLYIVREIVRAHGGTVAVESSDAGPTTFRVRLPRQAPERVAM